MKKILLFLLMLFTVSCAGMKDNTYDAIYQIGYGKGMDSSDVYDWDSRVDWIQLFQLDGDSVIHLKNETGLISIQCTPSLNEDGTLECQVDGIYVIDYLNIAHGWVYNQDKLNEFLGGDLEFTLFIDENNVVTSNDWPTLMPD